MFFETIKIVDNQIPLLRGHLKRVNRSLDFFKLKGHRFSYGEFYNWIMTNMLASGRFGSNTRARLVFTAEGPKYNYQIHWQATPLPAEFVGWVQPPICVELCPVVPVWLPIGPGIKGMDRMHYERAANLAAQMGVQDMLLYNEQGYITDGTIANCWIWESDSLVTPPISDGCVAGVFRQQIFEYSQKLGLNVKEESISQKRLMAANEVFMTNAIRGFLPIAQVAAQPFPVKNTLHLAEVFAAYLASSL